MAKVIREEKQFVHIPSKNTLDFIENMNTIGLIHIWEEAKVNEQSLHSPGLSAGAGCI